MVIKRKDSQLIREMEINEFEETDKTLSVIISIKDKTIRGIEDHHEHNIRK